MAAPFEYPVIEMSAEDQAQEREVFGGLTQSIRDLAEASLRTTIDPARIPHIQAQVEALTSELREQLIPGAFGVQLTSTGQVRGHGNAVVGLRNPVAPPLRIEHSPEGRAWSRFELNALYEGPPGKVHGGVLALVLDQIFGEAAAAGGSPGMTGTLTLRYLRNTPLGECSAEAWIDRREGVKTYVQGQMKDAAGIVTVEAEGIFILPRWAREAIESLQPPRFE